MNERISWAGLLLIAALTPWPASADLIFSDVKLTANTSTKGGSAPVIVDSDSQTIPNLGSGGVDALSLAAGQPFPNEPNTVGSAFASAAQLALAGDVLPGVGVNGFFLQNALFPPHTLEATASINQSATNNSTTETEALSASVFIPEPTMRFFGIGDFFPGGVDPDRDASAFIQARLETKHLDLFGTVVGEDTLLDYGMLAFREPGTGVFSAKTTDGGLELTRFVEPDGSFVFSMPELLIENLVLPSLGPGETLELNYIFTAAASTGFGETGIFAAIGDPFNLSEGGGSFEIRAGDAPPLNEVPEPSGMAMLGLAFIALGIAARRRRRLPPARFA